MGQPDSAVAAYRRLVDAPGYVNLLPEAYAIAPAWHRLAELYESKGMRTEALDAYAHFIARWKNADPELQPAVRKARRRMTALTASIGRAVHVPPACGEKIHSIVVGRLVRIEAAMGPMEWTRQDVKLRMGTMDELLKDPGDPPTCPTKWWPCCRVVQSWTTLPNKGAMMNCRPVLSTRNPLEQAVGRSDRRPEKDPWRRGRIAPA